MGLVIIKTFSNRIEADIALGLLESRGIPAMVQSDDGGGTMPYFSATNGVHLLVNEEDQSDAQKILED
jgi:hypothetical protein